MLHQIDEIQGIGLHLDLALRKVQDAYLRTFENLSIDMTIEQWVILHQIYELGEGASQRAIVQLNFRNRATISRVIGKLEGKGWIKKTRFHGDQKQYKLELLPKGEKIINQVLPKAIELRKQAVLGMDIKEFNTFLKVLEKIGDNYQQFSF